MVHVANDHRIIYKGTDSIAIVGVENSGKPPFPDRGNLPKALQGTDGMFKVLLSHDPTHWRRKVLPDTSVQLTLSGHTHDMQISLFGFSVSKFIYPEHRGLYLEGNRGLYVNIGLGYVLFPMRLGAWPEITVLTLKKEITNQSNKIYHTYEILIHHLPNLYRASHFLVLTILTALTTMLGCWLGNGHFWGYYPGKIWSQLTCFLFLLPVKVEGHKTLTTKHRMYS